MIPAVGNLESLLTGYKIIHPLSFWLSKNEPGKPFMTYWTNCNSWWGTDPYWNCHEYLQKTKCPLPIPVNHYPAQQVCLFLPLSHPLGSSLPSLVRLGQCNTPPWSSFLCLPQSPHSPFQRLPCRKFISLGKCLHHLSASLASSCLPVCKYI